MAGNIFINYRREESGHVAGRLHDSLAPKFGRDKLFMDVDNIPVGRDFEEYLNSQVAECDAMLAVIGPNWLTVKDETGQRRLDNPNDFIVIEIGAALARNIPVVPVLVDEARMPKASELPDSLKSLARRQAVQVRHANFSSDAEALIKRLRETLGYASSERRWRVRAAISAAAVAVLLLIGWGGYTLFRNTIERGVQQAEVKREQERKAVEAEAMRKVEEAEQRRLAAEAEQQRVAAAKADQARQAKAAAEAESKRKADAAEQERQARTAEAESKRKATEAAQQRPAVVNSEEARRGAWLGVKIQQVTDEIAKSLNITPARGALVAGVADNSPGKAGGIDVGDVIVKFDGKDIKEMRDLPRIVADTPVSKEVQVTIIRNGTEYTRTVKIGVLTAEVEEKRKADEAERQRLAALEFQLEDRALCSFALNSEKSGWDQNPTYKKYVTEASRRSLTVDSCRGILGVTAEAEAKRKADAAEQERQARAAAEAEAKRKIEAERQRKEGEAAGKAGDPDRAIANFNEAIQLNPNDAAAYYVRGFAYSRKGDYDRAMADYNEVIRLNPMHAAAFNSRGFIYDKKGDYDRALADYNEAIRINPMFAIAISNRGIEYGRKGDYDRAVSDFNEAIRLDPKYAAAFNGRGFTYMRKGENDQAMADYNEAIRIDPKYAVAFCNRGMLKRKINDSSGNADVEEAKRLDASSCAR